MGYFLRRVLVGFAARYYELSIESTMTGVFKKIRVELDFAILLSTTTLNESKSSQLRNTQISYRAT